MGDNAETSVVDTDSRGVGRGQPVPRRQRRHPARDCEQPDADHGRDRPEGGRAHHQRVTRPCPPAPAAIVLFELRRGGRHVRKRFRVGIAPIGWTNDDLLNVAGTRRHVGTERSGVAAMSGAPSSRATRRRWRGGGAGSARPRSLRRVDQPCSSPRKAMHDQTIRSFRDQMNYMKAVGATDPVRAELRPRGAPAGDRPPRTAPPPPSGRGMLDLTLHEMGRIA